MLRSIEVPENIKALLVNCVENRGVTLCAENLELGEVYIKWDNFQGGSLSPLVFALALIPLRMI